MPQNITRHVEEMVREADAGLQRTTPEEAKKLLEDDGVVFVDLRDPRELQREGKIPGAFHCTRGMLEFWIDPESPYHKEAFARDASFIFYCASGWRSALAARTALDMGLRPVSHLAGGFSAWRKAGGPVEDVQRK